MTDILTILNRVISNAAPLVQAPQSPTITPSGPNRVYIGKYHNAPPGARVHVSAEGKKYYVPNETPQANTGQQTTQPYTPGQAQNQDFADRYLRVINALKAQLSQYTSELQYHLQNDSNEPADPDHLHDLNDKVSQIQQELQVAQMNYDSVTSGGPEQQQQT